jgi:hypothetical protein
MICCAHDRMTVTKRMLRFFLWLALLLPAPALAQTQPDSGRTNVAPAGAAQSASPACVQVQVAGQAPSALNCLNQQLQQDVEGVAPTQSKLPLSADSPSNQVGTFNEQSMREQYGQNFGKSATPYRPPPPTFNTSLSH